MSGLPPKRPPKTAYPARRIVILAPPNAQSLEIAGPSEVFAFAEMKLREAGRTRASGYHVEFVSATPKLELRGWSGLKISADLSFDQVDGTIDTLLVVGGMEVWRPDSSALLDWLREKAKSVRRLGGLCTGTFLLAEAGVLDGKRVTTHWYFCQQLAERFPAVTVDSEPIFIRDGNLWTSAGGTSNLDVALAMVEDDLGADIAFRIAQGLVLFLRRAARQNQFSASLSVQSSSRIPLRELPVFILENLSEPLTADVLAAKAAMSLRSFSRIFRQEFGMTPKSFVEAMRLETAQRLVSESNKSLNEIARLCGFGGPDAMRRAFRAKFGKTPAEMKND